MYIFYLDKSTFSNVFFCIKAHLDKYNNLEKKYNYCDRSVKNNFQVIYFI